MSRASKVALTIVWFLLMLRTPMQAEIIYGITLTPTGTGTDNNQLLSFESATPETLLTFHQVTGFVSNDEHIIGGIDVRPSNGKLYGISQNNRIYIIDPTSGIATLSSTLSYSSPPPTSFVTPAGIDFDPVTDRLRVVTLGFGNAARNLLINVDTGDTIEQGNLSFAPGDPQTGNGVIFLLGMAYNRNFAGATATTLYAVTPNFTVGSHSLDIIDPPSSGILHTVGFFGATGASNAAFDISGITGTAYFTTFAGGFAGMSLYTVDLQTGMATRMGTVGDDRVGNFLTGIAAPIGETVPEPSTLALLTTALLALVPGSLLIRQRPSPLL